MNMHFFVLAGFSFSLHYKMWRFLIWGHAFLRLLFRAYMNDDNLERGGLLRINLDND